MHGLRRGTSLTKYNPAQRNSEGKVLLVPPHRLARFGKKHAMSNLTTTTLRRGLSSHSLHVITKSHPGFVFNLCRSSYNSGLSSFSTVASSSPLSLWYTPTKVRSISTKTRTTTTSKKRKMAFPKTIKAVVVPQHGDIEVIELIETPFPVQQPNEVLIKVSSFFKIILQIPFHSSKILKIINIFRP